MAVISFENLADDGKVVKVLDGYHDLNWNNFGTLDDEAFPATVFDNVIHSGEASAFNLDEKPASFNSSDRDGDFDLNGGYFTAFNTNDLKVKVVGFDDGERIARKVLLLDPTQDFVRFGPEFDDIDKVKFTVSGGTDADPKDNYVRTQFFAVDDLFIDF